MSSSQKELNWQKTDANKIKNKNKMLKRAQN